MLGCMHADNGLETKCTYFLFHRFRPTILPIVSGYPVVGLGLRACISLGPFLNGFFQHVNELACLLHALLPKCFGSDVKAQFHAQFRW